MHIAIDLCVYNSNYLGGVSRYALSITKALVESAVKFEDKIVILHSRKNAEIIKELFEEYSCEFVLHPKFDGFWYLKFHALSYKMHKAPWLFELFHFLFSIEIRRKIKGMDVIYCPTTYLNFNSKIPSVVSIHDTQELFLPENFSKDILNYRKLHRNFTFKYTDTLQVSSIFIENELRKDAEYNKKNNKTIVIREAVDRDKFLNLTKVKKYKHSIEILIPANFQPHKNHLFAISALAKAKQKRNIVVNLIGEGDLLKKCKNLAKELSSDKVQFNFLGKVNDSTLVNIYSESDIVLSCSSYESSSLPVLEALAAGSIPLISNIPAHLEMAENYPVCLYHINCEESLLHELDEIILNLESFYDESEIKFRQNSTKNSDWHGLALIYLKLFRELLP